MFVRKQNTNDEQKLSSCPFSISLSKVEVETLGPVIILLTLFSKLFVEF